MFCPQDGPFVCSGSYTIAQDDMDSGSRSTTYYVSSFGRDGAVVSNSTDHTEWLEGAADASVRESMLYPVESVPITLLP